VKGKILAVDDDFEIRSLLSDFLSNQGYEVTCLASAQEALSLLRSSGPSLFDLVISDLKMAQMDGMQFLAILKRDWPEVPVILITGHASIDTAIEAIQNGAFHYLVKPFKLSEVAVQVGRALETRSLCLEVQSLRSQLRQGWGLKDIIGKSPGMRAVFDLIERVAPSTANILIQGESGTGKEMVARAIHSLGPRSQKPFIAINCTAIPETLLESELFGHAKGAFTGASGSKRGLIEEAEGGTLFLDEIGDMSPTLQAKLLRVLQERKIRPVGSNSLIDVDIRVITATHKDLRAGIEKGEFREDLFYRLSVIPIVVPPLRERQEDILLLAEHFLKRYAAANGVGGSPRVRGISKEALGKLLRFRWQGNVRELENVIERAVVLTRGTQIEESDLPEPELAKSTDTLETLSSDMPTLTELEDRYIRLVLQRTAGRKERAAQILGVNRRTLYRKEREYGLVDGDSPDPDEGLVGNA
jgi:two-component system, NtrC family, response regulator HydG